MKINVDADDFGSVVICAIRYALGRQTYMPGIVARFAMQVVKEMNTKDLFVIMNDLQGYDFDKDEMGGDDWHRLYYTISKELKARD